MVRYGGRWQGWVAGFAWLFAVCALPVRAQERVELGAQIWLERGQSGAEIESWMHTLAVAHMPVARLFVMWSDVETAPGVWDFTLYDEAFRAAEQEHVRIVATLTPSGPPPFLGGDGSQGRGVVGSVEARVHAADYIRRVVERYRTSPALDTWLLLNEPGEGVKPDPLAVAGLPVWLQAKYGSVGELNRAWGKAYTTFAEARPPASVSLWNLRPSLDWSDYWRGYQTAQLAWLAGQVKQADSTHPLHVNPHSLLANLAANNDDLPAWRGFLDSLGSSIHPAWHFALLPRERYTLGVSYINDLVDGASTPKPHWVTELQGGNNITSGVQPLNPTADETAQWVWTSVGGGAKRVLFWLLNARSRGVEAGEWSLLDFAGRPSNRLRAAAEVAQAIDAHAEFFAHAHPVRPAVSLIVSLDTMTLEEHTAHADNPARGKDAQVLATLGFYEALSRLGSPPAVRHMEDYPWESGERGRVAILPDVRAVSAAKFAKMERFVQDGNTLLLSGLTGFYNTDAGAWPVFSTGAQPMAALAGARLKEVLLPNDSKPALQLDDHAAAPLPFELWESTLEPLAGTQVLARQGAEVLATRRDQSGGGQVIWLPATVGAGAWLEDAAPLASLLGGMLRTQLEAVPFRFNTPQAGCVLRVLSDGRSSLTVVANETGAPLACGLHAPVGWKAEVLRRGSPDAKAMLPAGGTGVLLWHKQ